MTLLRNEFELRKMAEIICLKIYDDSATTTSVVVVFTCIMFSNLIANTLMSIGLWKTKRRFTRPQKLYFCLCISDVLVGVLILPFKIVFAVRSNISCELMAVQQFLGFFSVSASMLIMLSIIIDRYLLITKTTFFNKHIVNQRIFITISTNIIIAFMLGIPNVIITLSNHKQVGTFMMADSIWMLLVIVVMATLNYLLITHVKKTATVTRRDTGVQGKYSSKATKLIFILSIIMAICYLPATVGRLLLGIYTYREETNTVLTYYNIWASPLFILNTTINSVVYVSRSTAIKDYFKHSIKQRKQRRNNSMKIQIYTVTNSTSTV